MNSLLVLAILLLTAYIAVTMYRNRNETLRADVRKRLQKPVPTPASDDQVIHTLPELNVNWHGHRGRTFPKRKVPRYR